MYDVRQFKPALYALVIFGITGFAIANVSPGLWAGAVALILLNIAWVRSGRFQPIPRFAANTLVILAAAYVAIRFTGEGTPVLIVGQFLVALQLIKLYEQRANRDFGQLIVLSLLLMVAAAISTTSLLFGMLMVAYLFLSLYCCLLFHLKVETDAARRNMGLSEDAPGDARRLRQDQRRLGSWMRRLTGLVSVVSVTCAVIVFLIFPRGSGAHLAGRNRAPFKSSEAVTGFSSQVSFQDIARITQNETPVAYLEVLRNGTPVRGTQTLYLRGNTLESYVADPDAIDRWTWRKSSYDFYVPISTADAYGQGIKIGGPVEDSVAVIEQRFELEPVGLDVLPTLAGTFLVAVGQQEFRYNRSDGTLSTNRALRRPIKYRAWSTGELPRPTSGAMESRQSNSQLVINDLMRVKWEYDRVDIMRLATLDQLGLREMAPQERVLAQHQRHGLLVPPAELMDSARGSFGEIVDYFVGRARRNPIYPVSPEIMRFALDPVVSGVDAEGQSLARQRLGRSGPTELDAEIARNISNYLQTQYSYTLDITDARLSSSQDPLAWFVSEDGQRGHCEFFAGTAALACQALGIPARIVVGFKCDEYNATLGKYVVRQSHAHAWVEVLTDSGWVTLDPTSGNGDDLTRRSAIMDKLTHWFEYLEYKWANSIVAYDNTARTDLMQTLETDVLDRAKGTAGLWDRFTAWLEKQNLYIYSAQLMAWLIALMVAGAVLVMAWYVFEQWRLKQRARRIGLRGLSADEQRRLARQLAFFDELVQLLERHGHRRLPSQTPREFAQSLAFLPREAFDAVTGLTDVFYRIRYGEADLTPRRQRHLSRSLERLSSMLSQR